MIYKSYVVEQNIKLLNKSATLFYGENLGLKKEFIDKIKSINYEEEIFIFSQEELIKNKEIIIKQIVNISLFQKNKIFLINQVNDKLFDIVKEILELIDTQKLYLFGDILEKKSKLRNLFEKSKELDVVPCYEDNEISIKKIINDRLRGFQGLTPINLNIILENSSFDRVKLNNELDKIILYFQNKKIETEKLEILLNDKVNESFNILKDEALMGNKTKTNKLLGETILEEEKNTLYLNILNQRLNKLYELRNIANNRDLETSMTELRPQIFWKDKPKFLAQAKKWNQEKIRRILKKTYLIEKEVKSNSNIDKKIIMKNLIIDICVSANTL